MTTDDSSTLTRSAGVVVLRAFIVVSVVLTVTLSAAVLSGLVVVDTPSPLRWSTAGVIVAWGLAALRSARDHNGPARDLPGWVVGYPGAVVVLASAAQLVIGVDPSRMLGVLVALGAMAAVAPRGVVLVTLVAAAGVQVATAVLHPPVDWLPPLVLTGLAAVTVWAVGVVLRRVQELQLAHTRDRAQIERRANGLAAVAEATHRLHVLEPDALLQAVADATIPLGWDMCGIYVPGPDGEHVVGGHHGVPQHLVDGPQRYVGVFSLVLDRGETVVLEDYTGHPQHNPDYGELRVAVGVPVVVDRELVGALVVGRRDATLEHDEVPLLEILGEHAGRALEASGKYELQRRAVEELEELHRLKGDFMANVSHELRTPMQVVLGMTETLDERWDELPPDLRRRFVARARRNAADLVHVIDQLLDFSRLEGGELELRREATPLRPVVRTVLDRAATLAGDHDLTADVPEECVVWADPVLVERVVDNLVTNACRHTPAGTTVTVQAGRVGGAVAVAVADDGPGIPAADLERLGERFYRGGSSHLRRTTRGMGLGLAFCREVLERHDAELEVDTTPGRGTTFRFVLPAVSDDGGAPVAHPPAGGRDAATSGST